MTIKILHTSDLHIGMKFNSYNDDVRNQLVEARFLSLENMINKSNDLECDLFVISGDLFNSIQVSKKDLNRTAQILNKFNGSFVLILPGNHDYDNNIVELWREFERMNLENVILLNKHEIYNLNIHDKNINIYPAHCHNKHSSTNNLKWIKEENINPEEINIGISHGAIEGLSADLEGNYFLMGLNELENIPVDIWLIGHTHVRYPYVEEIKNHKIFNAGTHEPDGLNYKDEGSCWYIELSKEETFTKRIITGKYRFKDLYEEIESDEQFFQLKEELISNITSSDLLRLNLKGSVSKDLYSNISSIYKELEEACFYLIVNDNELKLKVDSEIIKKEFTQGSFPYEFLMSLEDDEEALQLAYEMVRGK